MTIARSVERSTLPVLLRHLRGHVPDRLAAALSNCGGTNRAARRFAGNLTRPDMTESEFIAICHALIFPNGVRKTTTRSRNTALLRRLIDERALELKPSLRVLDIGASGGLDAEGTVELLAESHDVSRYVLGDLYTCVLYDRERGLVFDEDRKLLQVRRRGSFVSVNFSYNFDFQRLTNLPKRIRPWLLSHRYKYEEKSSVVRVPLLHDEVAIASKVSSFELRRMDVFEPFKDQFDLVLCLHLLVPRYFEREKIEAGVRNLTNGLSVGGSLVVGAAEEYRVIRRVSPTEIVERRFP